MTISGLTRANSQRGWRCALAALVLVLASSGAATAGASPAAAAPRPVFDKPCASKKVTGPFVVSGTQVYTNGGKGHKGAVPFVSDGPTLAASLDVKTWSSAAATAVADGKSMDEKEIAWAAADWCANTVRIQVNQDLLFMNVTVDDFFINESYLHAIETEVQDAVNHKLVVVLNDSTESSANASNELGPTLATSQFWRVMARIYGHVEGPGHLDGPAHVIFDLFNEPRDFNSTMSPSLVWRTWYFGSPPPPAFPPTYFGMESLAEFVRHGLGVNAQNLFWIEGPNFSDSFAGMYPRYLIKVSNVVYAIHHPLALEKKTGKVTEIMDNPTAWNAAFGYLVEKNIAPVVEGEWTNHELGRTAGVGNSACWPDAKTQVNIYLNDYLAGRDATGPRHPIGLSAYTLNSGYLLRQLTKTGANPDPREPTQITAAWTCVPGGGGPWQVSGAEGAGLAVYQFFKKQDT